MDMLSVEERTDTQYPVRVYTPLDEIPMTKEEAAKFLEQLSNLMKHLEAKNG